MLAFICLYLLVCVCLSVIHLFIICYALLLFDSLLFWSFESFLNSVLDLFLTHSHSFVSILLSLVLVIRINKSYIIYWYKIIGLKHILFTIDWLICSDLVWFRPISIIRYHKSLRTNELRLCFIHMTCFGTLFFYSHTIDLKTHTQTHIIVSTKFDMNAFSLFLTLSFCVCMCATKIEYTEIDSDILSHYIYRP